MITGSGRARHGLLELERCSMTKRADAPGATILSPSMHVTAPIVGRKFSSTHGLIPVLSGEVRVEREE